MTAAFHRSVLQQSRLQERVRWPPIQCEVSKPRPTKVLVVRFSEPRKYTDGYWRGWAHPKKKSRIANTASSTQANVRVGKIALRRKRIFLDCWYMAYNRAIIMMPRTVFMKKYVTACVRKNTVQLFQTLHRISSPGISLTPKLSWKVPGHSAVGCL